MAEPSMANIVNEFLRDEEELKAQFLRFTQRYGEQALARLRSDLDLSALAGLHDQSEPDKTRFSTPLSHVPISDGSGKEDDGDMTEFFDFPDLTESLQVTPQSQTPVSGSMSPDSFATAAETPCNGLERTQWFTPHNSHASQGHTPKGSTIVIAEASENLSPRSTHATFFTPLRSSSIGDKDLFGWQGADHSDFETSQSPDPGDTNYLTAIGDACSQTDPSDCSSFTLAASPTRYSDCTTPEPSETMPDCRAKDISFSLSPDTLIGDATPLGRRATKAVMTIRDSVERMSLSTEPEPKAGEISDDSFRFVFKRPRSSKADVAKSHEMFMVSGALQTILEDEALGDIGDITSVGYATPELQSSLPPRIKVLSHVQVTPCESQASQDSTLDHEIVPTTECTVLGEKDGNTKISNTSNMSKKRGFIACQRCRVRKVRCERAIRSPSTKSCLTCSRKGIHDCSLALMNRVSTPATTTTALPDEDKENARPIVARNAPPSEDKENIAPLSALSKIPGLVFGQQKFNRRHTVPSEYIILESDVLPAPRAAKRLRKR